MNLPPLLGKMKVSIDSENNNAVCAIICHSGYGRRKNRPPITKVVKLDKKGRHGLVMLKTVQRFRLAAMYKRFYGLRSGLT